MKSYSKVFKSTHLSLMEGKKVILQPQVMFDRKDTDVNLSQNPEMDKEVTYSNAHQIIQEAEVQAKLIIERAEEKARSLEKAAEEKISQWWEENQRQLEKLSREAEHKGYHDGYAQGKQEAMKEVTSEYQGKIEQIQNLLEQAYEQKASIISEAEPFLLELSTVIATHIIKKELDNNPEQFVELIKEHILRFKEKEFITVCVHPDDFDFIQAQRSHLIAVVNGETEIKIIPDHSVTSKGCIIRTAYGSVDARIDTQIEEIKKVILEVRDPESGFIS
ncbi:flagellar assembly protein FliH [Bacillus sp. SLBN-46]|uniref:flagellar assembly protein FliH n=1 Tax=Bacillus sp. SLBN-46 TaxID=3042283 RepID=UPI0028618D69|nr:flagellar assembly protein FliH [Bacillus sp. SLBN-46]MDR6123749.1 flagellar assembly protein FliH [Bacillus sp. SLBN-46]